MPSAVSGDSFLTFHQQNCCYFQPSHEISSVPLRSSEQRGEGGRADTSPEGSKVPTQRAQVRGELAQSCTAVAFADGVSCFRSARLTAVPDPSGPPWRLPGPREGPTLECLPGPGCTAVAFLSVQAESSHGKGCPSASQVCPGLWSGISDTSFAVPLAHKQHTGSALRGPRGQQCRDLPNLERWPGGPVSGNEWVGGPHGLGRRWLEAPLCVCVPRATPKSGWGGGGSLCSEGPSGKPGGVRPQGDGPHTSV